MIPSVFLFFLPIAYGQYTLSKIALAAVLLSIAWAKAGRWGPKPLTVPLLVMLVLRVHDELLSEINPPEDTAYRLDDFLKTMCETPAWAAGCPVAAEGWIGPR